MRRMHGVAEDLVRGRASARQVIAVGRQQLRERIRERLVAHQLQLDAVPGLEQVGDE